MTIVKRLDAASIVGFTGTRNGMTAEQKQAVKSLLEAQKDKQLAHGDCVGADAQADVLAGELGMKTVIWPPSNPSKRARRMATGQLMQELPYLERNKSIVQNASALIAAPSDMTEQPNGGTWFTVRYARQRKLPLTIVWPNGSTSTELHTTT